MTVSRDRLAALLDPASGLNGIDYAELLPGPPAKIAVHFLTQTVVDDPALEVSLAGGDRIPEVALAAVAAADWTADGDGRPILTLTPQGEGDFSNYVLAIDAPKLDPRFRETAFSFKVFCPSPFDCAPPPHECPPDAIEPPPIDYLAKDFTSFRQLLLEDSSQRYPQWAERSEADFGVVVAEALSALADELSYQQDRISADLNFSTAISRQALAAHARLVDYEPAPPRSAQADLMLSVTAASVPAGFRVNGVDGDGQRIGFEIGEGLTGPAAYDVDPRRNWPLLPWWWDDDEQCLSRGATELWLVGDDLGLVAGTRLLIQTDLPGETIRQIVTLTEVAPDFDPLFPPGTGTKLTHIAWADSDATARERDLALTQLGGNILPATQGVRMQERFAVSPVPATAASAVEAIAREGVDGTTIQRLPLRDGPLAWLTDQAAPEVRVAQVEPQPRDWSHARTLLDAEALDTVFAADQETWRAVTFAGDGRPTHWEPDGDDGVTLRFGDGSFGLPPEPGAVFDVTYRIGAGAAGNLPADAISEIPAPGVVVDARNPLPSSGGADAESATHVRRFAPQAFRAHPLRAVTIDDYRSTSRELDWVQDAGARFRWTGSWHSVFVAADPKGGFDPGADHLLELAELIERRRLAGVEALLLPPRFVSIDLKIRVCVAATFRRDDVERRVLDRLAPRNRSDDASFFFADRFTFGTPLYRARLEEAVADVPGVKGVLGITYRRRAALNTFKKLPMTLELGMGEILRVDNDPDWPERGSITILTEDGQ